MKILSAGKVQQKNDLFFVSYILFCCLLRSVVSFKLLGLLYYLLCSLDTLFRSAKLFHLKKFLFLNKSSLFFENSLDNLVVIATLHTSPAVIGPKVFALPYTLKVSDVHVNPIPKKGSNCIEKFKNLFEFVIFRFQFLNSFP